MHYLYYSNLRNVNSDNMDDHLCTAGRSKNNINVIVYHSNYYLKDDIFCLLCLVVNSSSLFRVRSLKVCKASTTSDDQHIWFNINH